MEGVTDFLIHDKLVKIDICDTSGQDRYQSFIKKVLPSKNLAIIIYDLSNKVNYFFYSSVRIQKGALILGQKSYQASTFTLDYLVQNLISNILRFHPRK